MRSPIFAAFGLLLFAGGLADAASWGKDRLWNDGRAEVAVYDSERLIDGKPRQFKEHLVTSKEELREEKIRALKLNQIQKIDLENSPINYLTSVVVREDPVQHVVKLTVGSQEWAGNTFKHYKGNMEGTGGTLTWYSYADGEADQSTELVFQKDDYFEDQLPLSLRALPFKEGYEKKIRVWDLLTSNRGASPLVSEVMLKVTGEDLIRCRGGSIPCWIVTLNKPAGTDTYWFDKKEPNILVKMETQDGRKRLLYARARWSYWDRRLPRPNILN